MSELHPRSLFSPPPPLLHLALHLSLSGKGKCLVFDDCYEHEVWNKTDGERVLLLFDLWHPDLVHEVSDVHCLPWRLPPAEITDVSLNLRQEFKDWPLDWGTAATAKLRRSSQWALTPSRVADQTSSMLVVPSSRETCRVTMPSHRALLLGRTLTQDEKSRRSGGSRPRWRRNHWPRRSSPAPPLLRVPLLFPRRTEQQRFLVNSRPGRA